MPVDAYRLARFERMFLRHRVSRVGSLPESVVLRSDREAREVRDGQTKARKRRAGRPVSGPGPQEEDLPPIGFATVQAGEAAGEGDEGGRIAGRGGSRPELPGDLPVERP